MRKEYATSIAFEEFCRFVKLKAGYHLSEYPESISRHNNRPQ
ncbi:hypothetical protein O7621_27485 [Solwaraspora sp. WMMD937]|nr:hypothetical protein [Solwaraspora sp. WMMD937]WFE21527.1 hypothetical protein O7621_27485 [Solwaraspora sp. WMMD937]